jgi:hypothetical protein
MEDLNDLYFFASVVQYGGFSAAARTIGVEKTRLSRRIAALEKRLGVRLLQRTTRALALTEAGQRFYEPKYGSRRRMLNRKMVTIVQHEQRRRGRSGSPGR